ncbi:MAG: VOC family protein [Gammaproteobacteria bacterium]
MNLKYENFYHTGMVVKDFDATCARLARESGVTFSPVINKTLPVWTRRAGEIRMLSPRAVYTVQQPSLEIIQEMPGTLWEAVPGRPLHHMGFWTTDIQADSAALERGGMPLVAALMVDGRMRGYCYHESSDGLLIELVDKVAFPDWKGFLEGRVPLA